MNELEPSTSPSSGSEGPAPSGRVVQVNVSPGGLPKLPVGRAWVGALGLDGDAVRERTVHGGPHRAVCLFGLEAIERLRAEGHPVAPGSTGENLTTSGIDWSLQPTGTRARIGRSLVLEVASATNPCSSQKPNFRDGRFSRISIALHPADSRMYARVLQEGEVAPGDEIRLEPPGDDSRAADEVFLARLDRASARADLATWNAAHESGHEITIVEDGELAMAAAQDLPGPAFNSAHGLAGLPNLVPDVIDFFDRHHVHGWLNTASAPWFGSVPETVLAVHGAPIADALVDPAADPAGLDVRRIGPADLPAWEEVRKRSGGSGIYSRRRRGAWNGVRSRLLESRNVHIFLATVDGQPVGSAVLTTSGRVGWLRGGVVVPQARGRGIQRAMIAARVSHAAQEGCDLIGSSAARESISSRNLERMGLRQLGLREQHVHRPSRRRLPFRR